MAERLYVESNRRLQKAIIDMQEHGTKITIVQVLMKVATKKMESARKNLESSHKEKQMM